MKEFVKKLMENNVIMEFRPCPEFRGIGVKFYKRDDLKYMTHIIDTVIFESEVRLGYVLYKMLDEYLESIKR